MQKGADADVAPDHVVPPSRVEEGVVAERRVAGVDVAEVGERDGGEVQARRRRVPARVACDDRERREQEIDVLQLQRQAQALRREVGGRSDEGAGHLVRVEGERVAHAYEVGVYPGAGVVSAICARDEERCGRCFQTHKSSGSTTPKRRNGQVGRQVISAVDFLLYLETAP